MMSTPVNQKELEVRGTSLDEGAVETEDGDGDRETGVDIEELLLGATGQEQNCTPNDQTGESLQIEYTEGCELLCSLIVN